MAGGAAVAGREVFVSYRRDDSNFVVGHLVDRLAAELGPDRLFRDLDSIPYGTDYRTHIDASLRGCRAALVVIGERWAGDGPHGRRLDDPTDLVRVEVEAVLARGIPVIPVLVHPVAGLDELHLPPSLDPLRYRQAIPLRPDPDFDNDVARVARALRAILDGDGTGPGVSSPPPAVAPGVDAGPGRPGGGSRRSRSSGRRSVVVLVVAAAAVLGAGVVATLLVGDGDDRPPPATTTVVSSTSSATTSVARASLCDGLQVDVVSSTASDEVSLRFDNTGDVALEVRGPTALSVVTSDGASLGYDFFESASRDLWTGSFRLPAGTTVERTLVVSPPLGGREIDRVEVADVTDPDAFGFPVTCRYPQG